MVKENRDREVSGDNEAAKPSALNYLILIETGMLIFLVITIIIAMATSTPLLYYWGLKYDNKILKVDLSPGDYTKYDFLVNGKKIRFEVLSDECCYKVTWPDGQNPVYCNYDAKTPPCSKFWIKKLQKPDAFIVSITSAKSSAAFDTRSMIIANNGERLYDGIFERIFYRINELGKGKYILVIFFLCPLLCYIWSLWRGKGKLSFIVVVGGFGIAIFMLWSNM